MSIRAVFSWLSFASDGLPLPCFHRSGVDGFVPVRLQMAYMVTWHFLASSKNAATSGNGCIFGPFFTMWQLLLKNGQYASAWGGLLWFFWYWLHLLIRLFAYCLKIGNNVQTLFCEIHAMQTGIYSDISNHDYHSGPGCSKSQLDLVNECPALLLWSKKAPVSFSEAAETGTALHTMLLEPGLFWERYALGPDHGRRSNAEKEAWEDFESGLGKKSAITRDDYHILREMRESVLAHPEAAALLRLPSALAEHSAYWCDSDTGLLCRCRPDLWVPQHGVVVDVKTTDDVQKFKWAIRDYRYDVQNAFYKDGIEAATGISVQAFLFLVIGKKREMGRYPVRVFELSQHDVDAGRFKYKQDLAVVAECQRLGVWPGIQSIEVPKPR